MLFSNFIDLSGSCLQPSKVYLIDVNQQSHRVRKIKFIFLSVVVLRSPAAQRRYSKRLLSPPGDADRSLGPGRPSE